MLLERFGDDCFSRRGGLLMGKIWLVFKNYRSTQSVGNFCFSFGGRGGGGKGEDLSEDYWAHENSGLAVEFYCIHSLACRLS